jgi:hypothetical protein
VPADDLAAWIAELRRRLEAGELSGLAPIEIGPGETPANVERGVQAMPAVAVSRLSSGCCFL